MLLAQSDLECNVIRSTEGRHASAGTISGSRGIVPPAPPPQPAQPPTLPPKPPPLPPAGTPQPPLGYQPNIVFIITDDQDVEIGGLEPMPKLRRLLGDAGATLAHFCETIVQLSSATAACASFQRL